MHHMIHELVHQYENGVITGYELAAQLIQWAGNGMLVREEVPEIALPFVDEMVAKYPVTDEEWATAEFVCFGELGANNLRLGIEALRP